MEERGKEREGRRGRGDEREWRKEERTGNGGRRREGGRGMEGKEGREWCPRPF